MFPHHSHNLHPPHANNPHLPPQPSKVHLPQTHLPPQSLPVKPHASLAVSSNRSYSHTNLHMTPHNAKPPLPKSLPDPQSLPHVPPHYHPTPLQHIFPHNNPAYNPPHSQISLETLPHNQLRVPFEHHVAALGQSYTTLSTHTDPSMPFPQQTSVSAQQIPTQPTLSSYLSNHPHASVSGYQVEQFDDNDSFDEDSATTTTTANTTPKSTKPKKDPPTPPQPKTHQQLVHQQTLLTPSELKDTPYLNACPPFAAPIVLGFDYPILFLMNNPEIQVQFSSVSVVRIICSFFIYHGLYLAQYGVGAYKLHGPDHDLDIIVTLPSLSVETLRDRPETLTTAQLQALSTPSPAHPASTFDHNLKNLSLNPNLNPNDLHDLPTIRLQIPSSGITPQLQYMLWDQEQSVRHGGRVISPAQGKAARKPSITDKSLILRWNRFYFRAFRLFNTPHKTTKLVAMFNSAHRLAATATLQSHVPAPINLFYFKQFHGMPIDPENPEDISPYHILEPYHVPFRSSKHGCYGSNCWELEFGSQKDIPWLNYCSSHIVYRPTRAANPKLLFTDADIERVEQVMNVHVTPDFFDLEGVHHPGCGELLPLVDDPGHFPSTFTTPEVGAYPQPDSDSQTDTDSTSFSYGIMGAAPSEKSPASRRKAKKGVPPISPQTAQRQQGIAAFTSWYNSVANVGIAGSKAPLRARTDLQLDRDLSIDVDAPRTTRQGSKKNCTTSPLPPLFQPLHDVSASTTPTAPVKRSYVRKNTPQHTSELSLSSASQSSIKKTPKTKPVRALQGHAHVSDDDTGDNPPSNASHSSYHYCSRPAARSDFDLHFTQHVSRYDVADDGDDEDNDEGAANLSQSGQQTYGQLSTQLSQQHAIQQVLHQQHQLQQHQVLPQQQPQLQDFYQQLQLQTHQQQVSPQQINLSQPPQHPLLRSTVPHINTISAPNHYHSVPTTTTTNSFNSVLPPRYNLPLPTVPGLHSASSIPPATSPHNFNPASNSTMHRHTHPILSSTQSSFNLSPHLPLGATHSASIPIGSSAVTTTLTPTIPMGPQYTPAAFTTSTTSSSYTGHSIAHSPITHAHKRPLPPDSTLPTAPPLHTHASSSASHHMGTISSNPTNTISSLSAISGPQHPQRAPFSGLIQPYHPQYPFITHVTPRAHPPANNSMPPLSSGYMSSLPSNSCSIAQLGHPAKLHKPNHTPVSTITSAPLLPLRAQSAQQKFLPHPSTSISPPPPPPPPPGP